MKICGEDKRSWCALWGKQFTAFQQLKRGKTNCSKFYCWILASVIILFVFDSAFFAVETDSDLPFGFTIWKLRDIRKITEKRRLPRMISDKADDRRKPPTVWWFGFIRFWFWDIGKVKIRHYFETCKKIEKASRIGQKTTGQGRSCWLRVQKHSAILNWSAS